MFMVRKSIYGPQNRVFDLKIGYFGLEITFFSDLQSVLDELLELEKNVVDTLLQPQKYGLQPRA